MIEWLLGVNLRAVLITIGAGFISIMLLLCYIAWEVKEIHDEEHKK